MRKVLFIILINLVTVVTGSAQNILQIKSFADDQFVKGNYSAALKEYQRVQFFDNDRNFNEIYSKIAEIYFKQNDYLNAIKYLNFSWTVEPNDSVKFELALKKSLCNIIIEDYYSALNDLLDIPETNSDYFQERKNLYLGICYFGLTDYNNSMHHFSQLVDSSGVRSLNHIFTGFFKASKKFNPDKIEMMSLFLPGLGQIYAGDVGSGINSIALLSGIVYYAYHTTSVYGWIDGALVLSSWFYRYYKGGSEKASLAAQEKLNFLQSEVYSEIISVIESNNK